MIFSIIAPSSFENVKCFEFFSEDKQKIIYFIMSLKEEGCPPSHYGYYMAEVGKSHYLNSNFQDMRGLYILLTSELKCVDLSSIDHEEILVISDSIYIGMLHTINNVFFDDLIIIYVVMFYF